MRASSPRTTIIVFAAFALGSCSYSYDLLAVVIGGRLAFVVDPASTKKPECVSSITVSTDNGETAAAKPVAGDDYKLVSSGAFWWVSLESGNCENRFPIFYGQPLKGKRLVFPEGVPSAGEESSFVQAKPLQIGVRYELTTTSGVGYGAGWFRINKDRRVENWIEDPTPIDLTEPVTESANASGA